jgi:6-pyruvoyltetrahydropterin/6-carboxytetrahydropterin synthase
MFEISVEQTFAAGHALRDYKGKCENVHGHNYRVRVTIEGEQLDSTGLLVDFLDVKRLMGGAIEYLDHRFINDLEPFDKINPSAENIAKYFYDRLQAGLKNELPVRISEIRVWETDTSSAVYRP